MRPRRIVDQSDPRSHLTQQPQFVYMRILLARKARTDIVSGEAPSSKIR